MADHSTRATLPRFLAVGVASTVFNYGLYWLLLRAGLGYGPAFVAGFALGVVVGFVLNHSWTYAGHGASGATVIARYLAVYGVSMLAGYALLHALVAQAGIDARWANLFVIAQSTVINYAGTRFLVFTR